jgi:phosphonate transport system substrate-binding protein
MPGPTRDSRLIVGAVAYDPKVVTIWEGLADYLNRQTSVRVDVMLFLSYEAQIDALLAGRIDIGWNTNLAFVQSRHRSDGRCRPLAMRDTDVEWRSVILAVRGGPVTSITDLRGRTLGLGSRDSGHAAILPVHFLAEQGLVENADYRSLRFDGDVGKHGDTGRTELEVLAALLDGRVDAGAVGSLFWGSVQENRLAPEGAVAPIWQSPAYHHCMFTTRPGLDAALAQRFAEALFAMSFENPEHRPILEMEGLKAWVPPRLDGYESLERACQRQGLL